MGQLGGNILDEMRESLEEINFAEMNKGEIKKEISDWDNQRILKEILVQAGYTRNTISSLTEREILENSFANVTHMRKRKEEHHHHRVLHKCRAQIYRQKLEELGVEPAKVIQQKSNNLDVKDEVKRQLREEAVNLAYEH